MGLIHLDAGVLIGFFNADDAHHAAAISTLQAAAENRDELAIASSVLAECLVAPSRQGDEAITTVRAAVDRFPIQIVDLTAEIAIQAARLRAQHRALRLPDAIVIATAGHAGADQLVTTDRQWPRPASLGIGVEIIQI